VLGKWNAFHNCSVAPQPTPLFDAWNDVLLYRTLATLRLDVPTFDTVDALRWTGPCTDFEDCCRRLQSLDLFVHTTSVLGNVPSSTSK
jgi:hypothetical protein